MNITEVLVPAQDIAWLPWAVQYFFYIGSAYAAAILFLIALIFKDSTSHLFRSSLVVIMAIGAIVGPLALTGDLHQPGRAWHFYAHLTPWSWMSLGSLFLPLFSGLTVLTAWLYLREDIAQLKHSDNPFLRKLALLTLGQWQVSSKQLLIVASLTVLSGLSIAVYTGAEIAVIASRPLWNQPASPLLWFTTAFIAAIGFTLLMSAFLPSSKGLFTACDQKIIKNTVSLNGVLGVILVSIWASNHSHFSLYENSDWVINITSMTAALLVCILLSFASEQVLNHRVGLALMSFTCLVCAWVVRWVTMMEVQTIPRFDAGAFPYELPMGSAGWLGIIGMLGLWLAMALFASEVISLRKNAASHSSLSRTPNL